MLQLMFDVQNTSRSTDRRVNSAGDQSTLQSQTQSRYLLLRNDSVPVTTHAAKQLPPRAPWVRHLLGAETWAMLAQRLPRGPHSGGEVCMGIHSLDGEMD